MTKNLDVAGGKCYGEGGQVYDPPAGYRYPTAEEVQANCVKYGRLYDWATAMGLPSKCNSVLSESDEDCAIKTPHQGICPTGWHLPSDAEWATLIDAVGGSSVAGTKLKATSGWNFSENIPSGTDDIGFAALPGGYSGGNDRFAYIGNSGYWWSTSDDGSTTAYTMYISYSSKSATNKDRRPKIGLASVRCVKNITMEVTQ